MSSHPRDELKIGKLKHHFVPKWIFNDNLILCANYFFRQHFLVPIFARKQQKILTFIPILNLCKNVSQVIFILLHTLNVNMKDSNVFLYRVEKGEEEKREKIKLLMHLMLTDQLYSIQWYVATRKIVVYHNTLLVHVRKVNGNFIFSVNRSSFMPQAISKKKEKIKRISPFYCCHFLASSIFVFFLSPFFFLKIELNHIAYYPIDNTAVKKRRGKKRQRGEKGEKNESLKSTWLLHYFHLIWFDVIFLFSLYLFRRFPLCVFYFIIWALKKKKEKNFFLSWLNFQV